MFNFGYCTAWQSYTDCNIVHVHSTTFHISKISKANLRSKKQERFSNIFKYYCNNFDKCSLLAPIITCNFILFVGIPIPISFLSWIPVVVMLINASVNPIIFIVTLKEVKAKLEKLFSPIWEELTEFLLNRTAQFNACLMCIVWDSLFLFSFYNHL